MIASSLTRTTSWLELLTAEENADEAGGAGLASGRPDRLPRKAGVANQAGGPYRRLNTTTASLLREGLVTEARQDGERAAKILSRRWPVVDTLVTQGDPQVEIVHAAEDWRVDLTVLGARGLGPRKRFFVGSTSLAVVRYAPCPVAIVRGRPRPVRHVLVSVDGSEGSRVALRFLSKFQLLRDARVSLLHVLQRPTALGLHRLFASLPDRQRGENRRTQQASAEEMLTGAAAALAEARSPVDRLVVDGDPAQEIVSMARRRDVDLVVLGSRGLGTIGRLLLGSVSETVLHHAGRPVVIARAR